MRRAGLVCPPPFFSPPLLLPPPLQLAHGAPRATWGCWWAVGRPVLRVASVGGRSWPAQSPSLACLHAASPHPRSLALILHLIWCAILAQFPRVLFRRPAHTGIPVPSLRAVLPPLAGCCVRPTYINGRWDHVGCSNTTHSTTIPGLVFSSSSLSSSAVLFSFLLVPL